MAQTYFQFKQFIIHQSQCAMKVTTDACLFGSVVATHFEKENSPQKVLDLGTGTGLLALLFAQKNARSTIDAVEVEPSAFAQAGQNVAQSPWREKIKVIQSDIRQFEPGNLYDLIIANPPFFEKQLASANEAKNLAHHSSQLSLHELLSEAKRLLRLTGSLFLLMPFYRESETILLAKKMGFQVAKIIRVRQTPAHTFFRTILLFQAIATEIVEEEITIKINATDYSQEFTELLQPYYLYL